jgi:universal stress protein A
MEPSFKRVMLPVDFSDHSDRIAQYAAWFAAAGQGTVHLVHVVSNPADSLYEPQEVPNWVMIDHANEKSQQLLESFAQRSLPAGCRRELRVMAGDPREKIMEAADEIGADLIVLSTHGRSGIAHIVMGSVAEYIVRHAKCPVFIVRRD